MKAFSEVGLLYFFVSPKIGNFTRKWTEILYLINTGRNDLKYWNIIVKYKIWNIKLNENYYKLKELKINWRKLNFFWYTFDLFIRSRKIIFFFLSAFPFLLNKLKKTPETKQVLDLTMTSTSAPSATPLTPAMLKWLSSCFSMELTDAESCSDGAQMANILHKIDAKHFDNRFMESIAKDVQKVRKKVIKTK